MKSKKKTENQNNDFQMEQFLKHALKPMDEPDRRLNTKLLAQVKEEQHMRKHRIPAVVFAAVCILLIGSISAAAAIHFLTPKEVAEEQGDARLAVVMGQENTLDDYESQTVEGYKVTFLGQASGENISDQLSTHDGEIVNSATYAVIAIENEDGSPMPEKITDWPYTCRNMFLVEGYSFSHGIANGSSGFVKNGVVYYILDADNMEIFADRTVYLAIYGQRSDKKPSCEVMPYLYDEKTGKYSRNNAFEGMNALFEVPLNPEMADPEAAEKYMEDHVIESDEITGADDINWPYKLVSFEEVYTSEGQNRLSDRGELVASVPCQVEESENGIYAEFAYEISDDPHYTGRPDGHERAIDEDWKNYPAGSWLRVSYGEGSDDNATVTGYAEMIRKESDGSLKLYVYRITEPMSLT